MQVYAWSHEFQPDRRERALTKEYHISMTVIKGFDNEFVPHHHARLSARTILPRYSARFFLVMHK